MKAFAQIQNRAELLERVVDGKLSVGNKYNYVSKFLFKNKNNPEQVEVKVLVTSRFGGVATLIRYL